MDDWHRVSKELLALLKLFSVPGLISLHYFLVNGILLPFTGDFSQGFCFSVLLSFLRALGSVKIVQISDFFLITLFLFSSEEIL